MYRELEYRSGQHTIVRSGKIEEIEYDPNRTAYIASCTGYGRKYYKVLGGKTQPVVGATLKVQTLGEIAIGGQVYSVSTRAGARGTLAMARGASCKVVKQEATTTVIRLPSTEIKRLNNLNTCSEGAVYGRPPRRLGTAGAHRRLGVRPSVRGVAMNPSDHPNGGKTHSSKVKNLWGKLAK